MLELRHLRSLLAIRDSGSLAAAAPRVHLTQSALSHQIRGLEDYFGVPLFFRNQRPLRPTPAGERLIRLAEEILPAVSAAEEALRQAARGSRGRLHMAIECHSCFQWLMPTLERYRREWPQVELDFSLGFSFHPLPALYRGDIDLVVTADPEEDYGGLRFTPLFRYEVQLLVPRAHRLAERPFIEPADLAGETLISYPVCRSKLDVFSRFLTPAGIEPAAVRTSELTALIVQLVASGRGVAALPNWAAAEFLQSGSLAALPLGPDGLWSTLYTAAREEDAELPYMQAFIACARATTAATLDGIEPLAA
ncbi:MAG: LysR family transcriptional regulator [Burkholderiales bacterium]|nr:LysR family transcriptional regulator [Burkholderiales bacterium]